ncbi:MAG: hypothetical protein GY757_28360, partial [bacterium]|nr:hypothetical protein [bacterium]
MKKLAKKNIRDIVALTPMQEGMLYSYLLSPESDYFEQISLGISGAIEPVIFEESWNIVTAANEMLRTLFRWENVQKPVQITLKAHRVHMEYRDLTLESGDNPGRSENEKELVREIMARDREKHFDLREVPFRVTLCKIAAKKYYIIISNHHIIYDGWSNGIILKEFFRTYAALTRGENPLRPEKT